MVDLQHFIKEKKMEISAIILIFLASRFFSDLITDNYNFIEPILLILIFGIVNEFWNRVDKGESVDAIIEISNALFGKIGAQFGLVFAVGSVVYFSTELQNIIEFHFGPLAAIQLIAIVVILSRLFVDMHESTTPSEIFDWEKEAYVQYTASFIAIISSYAIRSYYPVQSDIHNEIVIFVSVSIPVIIFYFTEIGDQMISMSAKRSG